MRKYQSAAEATGIICHVCKEFAEYRVFDTDYCEKCFEDWLGVNDDDEYDDYSICD